MSVYSSFMKRSHYKVKWRQENKCINCGSGKPDGWVYALCPNCRKNTLASKKRRREAAKDRKRCTNCRVQMPADWPLTKCEACGTRQRAVQVARREQRKAAGMCGECGERPPQPRRRMCKECADSGRMAAAKRCQRLVEQGLCIDCGNRPPRPQLKTCRECHVDNRYTGYALKKTRHLAGECVYCGIPNPERKHRGCPACRFLRNEKRRQLKIKVMNIYGGVRCACCGDTHEEFLEIDHVNNDGKVHRKKDRAARSLITWLRKHKYPPGFQVLCRNCNMAKWKFGECPHQRERKATCPPS